MESASIAINNFLYGSKDSSSSEPQAPVTALTNASAPTETMTSVESSAPAEKSPLAQTAAKAPSDPELTTVTSKQAGTTDTTVDQEVAPAVEHEHKTKIHEEREQKVIEKERHQDHYHTTVQPLKDSETLPEKHKTETEATQYKEVEHDDSAAVKAKLDQQQAGFKDTKEVNEVEQKVKEKTVEGEHVHHHLHETIQPVIEKDVVEKEVVHKVIPIKEKHHEVSEDHGVTTNKPMSVDDFKGKLSGEAVETKVVHDGTPAVDIKDTKDGKHVEKST
nr:hypothetical protein B0A51_03496 [Rachicladosporium sp. CCFEE 5018]